MTGINGISLNLNSIFCYRTKPHRSETLPPSAHVNKIACAFVNTRGGFFIFLRYLSRDTTETPFDLQRLKKVKIFVCMLKIDQVSVRVIYPSLSITFLYLLHPSIISRACTSSQCFISASLMSEVSPSSLYNHPLISSVRYTSPSCLSRFTQHVNFISVVFFLNGSFLSGISLSDLRMCRVKMANKGCSNVIVCLCHLSCLVH